MAARDAAGKVTGNAAANNAPSTRTRTPPTPEGGQARPSFPVQPIGTSEGERLTENLPNHE